VIDEVLIGIIASVVIGAIGVSGIAVISSVGGIDIIVNCISCSSTLNLMLREGVMLLLQITAGECGWGTMDGSSKEGYMVDCSITTVLLY